jgi:non-specific serine/threonine protein kinase
LTRSAALALALGEPARAAVDARHDLASAPLTKRQLEVSQLIAGGQTNKQIAARLFISERTVENHVSSILNRMGFNSRTQIASHVSGHVEEPNV